MRRSCAKVAALGCLHGTVAKSRIVLLKGAVRSSDFPGVYRAFQPSADVPRRRRSRPVIRAISCPVGVAPSPRVARPPSVHARADPARARVFATLITYQGKVRRRRSHPHVLSIRQCCQSEEQAAKPRGQRNRQKIREKQRALVSR